MARHVALILIVSALLLGAAVVRRLGFALYPFEAVALTVTIGLFSWTWLAFLTALVLPYAFAVPLVVATCVIAASALWFTSSAPFAWRTLEGGRTGWILWGAATAVLTVVFVVLFWTHSLLPDETGVYSASSAWADYGLHAAIITHLAAFDRMPMDLPIASGANMTYPFLIDLLSAHYVRVGSSLHLSLFVPGLLLALAGCQLVIAFGLRLFAHIGAAVGGLLLFLLAGSAGGLGLAWADWRASGLSLRAFLSDLPRDYTVLNAENGYVTNFVPHALIPQRAFLFGLAIALTVLILLHTARDTGDRRLLVFGALLIGLLPMAHAHSFLVSGAMLFALAVEATIRTRRPPWDHLLAGALALAVAAPQLLWQQLGNGGGTGGRFRFGWMVRDGESIWAYWWFNFGVMGIFFVVLPLLLIRPAWRRHLVWYLPALGVLVITQVYAFQPYEYDNLKLIYYVYLMASLFVTFLAVRAVEATRWSVVALVPVVFVVTAPGLLSVTNELQQRDQFANTSDVSLAAWVRDNTAPDDVFLATDRSTQPIATLGGRSIVLGYRGWLYNFSIPYDEREAAVRAALQGRPDDPAVQAFAPEYLAVSVSEDESWGVDRDALTALPVAYQNDGWTVFRLPYPDDTPTDRGTG